MSQNQDFLDYLQDNKAAYVLSNVAEVVERILTFIPTKSLLRVASVCRLWRNCARRVLRTQQQFAWVSAHGPSNTDEHVLCGTLAEEVEKVFLLPKTVFALIDSDSFNGQAFCYRKSLAAKGSPCLDPLENLNQLFPKGCDIMGITSPGVVLTPTGSCSPQELQEGEGGFAVMFPGTEGVNIRSFHFCEKTISKRAMKEAGLIDNPELRVVLLFFYETYSSDGGYFISKVMEPLAKSKVLVAGGLVESAFFPPRNCCKANAYGVVGLTLSGSKVQGASVILDGSVGTAKEAEATIQRLKAVKIPEKNTVGFMFACLGRGKNSYNQQVNVEADAFHKVFPNTPLFGLFGNGEIGCDQIIKDNYTLADANTHGLHHEYTTVMTLVHMG